VTTAELPMTTTQLEARPVQGPSALGGGWPRFLRLTWLVAKTDFKLTYYGSVLGYLWSLMQPLLFFGVLYVMFSLVLQLGKTTPDFPVILLMNIVLFNFFQAGTGGAIPSVVQRENLVRKMHFPRLVIPTATVLTASINLLLNMIVVVGFMLASGVGPRPTWLLLPVILALLFAITIGIAMLLSALYVRYRDIAPIWAVISQTLFYATPVFILVEQIQAKAPGVVRYYLFNPLATILVEARHWMVGPTPVPHATKPPFVVGLGASSYMGGPKWLVVPAVLLVAMCVVGYRVFSRRAPLIAEEL
jgi:ABC-2 type transport system permease protein